jgi:hypothetical protein
MNRLALIAALSSAVAAAAPTGPAAAACAASTAAEAEAGIRYVTDLMVISSVCQDTVYAEFRLRNKDAIVAYQKALIAHFHGNAAFDRWNTALANQAAQRDAGKLASEVCQRSAPMQQQARALDSKGFRAYAAAQAANNPQAKCGK